MIEQTKTKNFERTLPRNFPLEYCVRVRGSTIIFGILNSSFVVSIVRLLLCLSMNKMQFNFQVRARVCVSVSMVRVVLVIAREREAVWSSRIVMWNCMTSMLCWTCNDYFRRKERKKERKETCAGRRRFAFKRHRYMYTRFEFSPLWYQTTCSSSTDCFLFLSLSLSFAFFLFFFRHIGLDR